MKAIVVAGGDAAPGDAALLADAQLLIAADSGAEWVSRCGVVPDLLIGDMDSIWPALLERLEAEGVAVERHPAAKEASDAELAVARAVAGGADEVVIIGGLAGERLDHELANLLMLAGDQWDGVDLSIVRGTTTVRAVRAGTRELAGEIGDLVTLLAVGGDAEAVTTNGLRYPLAAETLHLGSSRGLSNEVEQAPASVSLESGTLLVFETRKEPGA